MRLIFKFKNQLCLLIVFFSFTANAQKILFVGNSLTYSNNLSKILEQIAKKSGESINTKSLCFPNYAIIDHLNEGKLQQVLTKEKFDYLVVQQGPSSQEEGKKMLINDGKKLKKLCEKHQVKMVYFMVWTSKKWYHTFNLVIKNHEVAAQKNEALLFPVGKIWKAYNESKGKESLYDSDGFHPSKTGSFLAALTMFHELYPKKNLNSLQHSHFKKWAKNKDSFLLMIDLLQKK